ncbi:hypothetical protein [Pedobacter zeae]|uniref:Uncharacterized protein n=1 Tax=Pedobacter zeae TaxID=1737356 RepID=A0A7W6P558_9SPHI|nr:hypothetical protein [Pedobacter zeae]MBB4107722.1 hypothetical protein [Pedobacter zeae]GGG97489.1 hypothetical protein GCM10007422_09320 [Pedobacter zeae]
MTNEQAKQEAIKKAYGDHYGIFKPNENGIGSAIGGIDENKYETISSGFVNTYRPKVLRGIETNNGWIRIEPDGSNLPGNMSTSRFKIYYDLIDNQYHESFDALGVRNMFRQHCCTHYKPFQPELKPIY